MKFNKTPLTLVCLAALALFFTGCNSDKRYAAHKNTQFLGIMESKPGSFDPTDNSAITLKTDEIVSRDNVSGDQVSLLWGLIRFQDY